MSGETCQKCGAPATEGSRFCEEHQPAPFVVEKDPPPLVRPEILIGLALALAFWGYYAFRENIFGSATVKAPAADSQASPAVAAEAGPDNDPALSTPMPTASRQASSHPDRGKPPVVAPAGTSPGACGNGAVDNGEQCDGRNLDGATCASLGFAGDCGASEACIRPALACTSRCAFDYSGCTLETVGSETARFVQSREGLSFDRVTGLVWELKCTTAECTRTHDILTRMTWKMAAGEWVEKLNEERFAGYDDWRLPTVEELRTLLVAVPPCLHEPCPAGAWPERSTVRAAYWSSTSFSLDTQRAWAVSFRDGEAFTAEKQDALHVRAVRRP